MSSDVAKKDVSRIRGLDTIRFVCALWVFFRHSGGPLPSADHGIAKAFQEAFMSIINGPAAVIVFFVISGLCIHFPYRNGRELEPISFYTRRMLRIGLPIGGLAIVVLLSRVPFAWTNPDQTILWSVFAEILYYLIYPALLLLRRRIGWKPILIGAALVAFGVAIPHPSAGNYGSLGLAMTWVLGFPCWIAGCVLAEAAEKLPAQNRVPIAVWRLGAIFLSALAMILRWHLPGGLSLGYPISLNLFAIYVYFWIAQEIVYNRNREPIPWLEKAGTWSYSLYLMHIPLMEWLHLRLNGVIPVEGLLWLLVVAGVLAGSYLFFRLAEKPAMDVAVWLSRRVVQNPPRRPSPQAELDVKPAP